MERQSWQIEGHTVRAPVDRSCTENAHPRPTLRVTPVASLIPGPSFSCQLIAPHTTREHSGEHLARSRLLPSMWLTDAQK